MTGSNHEPGQASPGLPTRIVPHRRLGENLPPHASQSPCINESIPRGKSPMKLRLPALLLALGLQLPLTAHALPACSRDRSASNAQKIACLVLSSFTARHLAASKRLAELQRSDSSFLDENSATTLDILQNAAVSSGRYSRSSVSIWNCTGTGAAGSCTSTTRTLYFCHNTSNMVYHLDSNSSGSCSRMAEDKDKPQPPKSGGAK